MPTGLALRTIGALDDNADANAEAVAVLLITASRLEHAHALVELAPPCDEPTSAPTGGTIWLSQWTSSYDYDAACTSAY